MNPDTSGDDASQILIARALATVLHRNQRDKLGEPYIDHPRRVAERVEGRRQAVAWLHDVVEDCDVPPEVLVSAGVAPDVVEAVRLLTRSDDVSGVDYYAAIRLNADARAVKLADIADNLAPWRTAHLEPEVRERLATKYAKARAALGEEKEDAL